MKTYTERELEIAYCIGLLGRNLSIDDLSVELRLAREKITLLKEAIDRGDFTPNTEMNNPAQYHE